MTSLSHFLSHTHNDRGQGQPGMSGGSEGGESVLLCVFVGGMQADKTVQRVKASLFGWGLAAAMVGSDL